MTSLRRLDGDLPVLLEDLYLAGTPDYRDDLFRRTARVRQRPVWTFPERWLPMELTTTRVSSARIPWRPLGAVVLIALLIVAALALYVGSNQPRLPAPFGPAANGALAYASDGDIFVSDAAGRASQRLTSGPAVDTDPLYAPDGRHLSFLRARPSGGLDLMVIAADGGEPTTVSSAPLAATDVYEWAPDGRWLLLSNGAKQLIRLDALGQAEPRILATDAFLWQFSSAFRPPDGRQIMFFRDSVDGLWVMDADGRNAHLVLDNPNPETRDFRYARWSPDGTMIALPATVGDGVQYRTFVANADGTGFRRLSTADGTYVEQDLRWSPDGRKISFNHWREDATGVWAIQPIGILDVATGAMTEVVPTGSPDGTLQEWSPDGTSLTALPGKVAEHGSAATAQASIIDIASGRETPLPWTVQTSLSWQRLAP